jgi:hypothetical protein
MQALRDILVKSILCYKDDRGMRVLGWGVMVEG